tara:strand:- start:144457 stop:145812 length:1356 start_codon:yes stop_codon:yes gene_type:complete
MISGALRVLLSLTLIVLITHQLFAQEKKEIFLTLNRAVMLGLKNNEAVLRSKIDVNRAKGQVKEALSEALPKINFKSSFTRNWALPVFTFGGQQFKAGTDNVINFGVDLSQTIYRGGQVGAGLKMARYYQQISETNSEQMQVDIVLMIHNSYYDVLLTEAIVEVSEAAYKRAITQYEGVKRFFEAGTVSDYDVLRAKVEVTNAKVAVNQAKNRVSMSKANLKQIIGLPQSILLRCITTLEVDSSSIPKNISTAVRNAMSSRSDLKAAKLETAMNEASIRLARGKRGADISLSAGYIMQAQINDPKFKSLAVRDFSRSWNTLLNVSFPIFDGRRNMGQVLQAEAEFEKSRYNEKQLEKQIEVDVTMAMLNIFEASERVDASAEAIKLANRGVGMVQLQYESGLSTQLELIDAQLTLKQAETDRVTAQYDYVKAAAMLKNLLGQLGADQDVEK